MKIRPVKTKSKPMTPAVLAVISTLLTGCDRQSLPGDVPHRVPGEPPEQHLTGSEPAVPAPSTEPEELPQLLGGDVPAEHIHHGE
ncbi:MAG: hypothetical protein E7034_08035 [Akkermansiaceae bacterium]|nr:hypothetical protein [Akkermansiaceae bacterium]